MNNKDAHNNENTLDLIARTVAHISEHMVTKKEFHELKAELAGFQLETERNFKSVRHDINELYRITDALE